MEHKVDGGDKEEAADEAEHADGAEPAAGDESQPEEPRAEVGVEVAAVVPLALAGQREALLLKDAKMLAKNMVKQLPASRHGEAGEAIAEAFLVEAKMQK